MSTWTSDEIEKIGTAEELEIASLRSDGALTKPVTIWVVRHGDDLYVRSGYGRTSGWFRATQAGHEGYISAGGVEKDVSFVEEPAPGTNDGIDAMYRAKYHRYAANYLKPMMSSEARGTTIKLVPRSLQQPLSRTT